MTELQKSTCELLAGHFGPLESRTFNFRGKARMDGKSPHEPTWEFKRGYTVESGIALLQEERVSEPVVFIRGPHDRIRWISPDQLERKELQGYTKAGEYVPGGCAS